MGRGDPVFCVATGLPSSLRLASLQRPPRPGAGREGRVCPGSQHGPLPLKFTPRVLKELPPPWLLVSQTSGSLVPARGALGRSWDSQMSVPRPGHSPSVRMSWGVHSNRPRAVPRAPGEGPRAQVLPWPAPSAPGAVGVLLGPPLGSGHAPSHPLSLSSPHSRALPARPASCCSAAGDALCITQRPGRLLRGVYPEPRPVPRAHMTPTAGRGPLSRPASPRQLCIPRLISCTGRGRTV